MCDLALVLSYSSDSSPIDVRIVRSVISDKANMGLEAGASQPDVYGQLAL